MMNRMKEIREKTGLSAKAFGEKYGIPYRTIEGWERGKQVPEYVLNMLAQIVALDEVIPVMFVFNEYRDKAGTGTAQTFIKKAEAISAAKDAWNSLNENDKESYREDEFGFFGVDLAVAAWDDVAEEFVPDETITQLWSAF